MWWAGPEPVDLFVGVTGTAWWREPGPMHTVPVQAGEPDLGAAMAGAARLTPDRRRTRLRVWLSGALAQPFVMPSVTGLHGAAEARAAGLARAAQETNWSEPLRVWFDGQPGFERSVLGVAVKEALLERISRAAGAAGVRLLSVRPWWAFRLPPSRSSHGGPEVVLLEDPDAVVLIACRGNTWHDAAAYAPWPAPAELESLVRRRATDMGLAAGQVGRVGAGALEPLIAPAGSANESLRRGGRP